MHRSGDKLNRESKRSDPSNDLSGASELSKIHHSISILAIIFIRALGQSKSVALYSPVPNEEPEAVDNLTGEKPQTDKPAPSAGDEQPLPSTTEYLESMTNSDSPPGLLPRYSSWSLCCIGRASDYIPNKGLI